MMQDMVPDVPRFVRKRVISAGPRSNLRSLADVVEGLFAEFGSLALPTVLATVRHCRGVSGSLCKTGPSFMINCP